MAKRKLTAVQTSAGKGNRLRPLNLYSLTSMIPKGLLRIMGMPIAELQLEQFKAGKIKDVYQVTQYLENREHLSARFSDGRHRFGLNIHYSDPMYDETNNGSGDAILTNIGQYKLKDDSLWLPNDNLFEFNLERILKSHEESRAAVTVLAIRMNPRATIKNYGLLNADQHHRLIEITEKPETEQEVMKALKVSDPRELDRMSVLANAGGYMLNNDALSKLAKEKWVIEGRKKTSGDFDMAGSLLAGMIHRDYKINVITIDAWGDFGTTSFFLETFQKALNGYFPSIYETLKSRGYEFDDSTHSWFHKDSLRQKYTDGKTLEQRLALGRVEIGPNVFIGRDSIIDDGAQVRYSDLEKYSRIGTEAVVEHTYLSPYCQVGPYAYVGGSALGLATKIRSSKHSQTHVNGGSVTGPSIIMPEGTWLDSVTIFPGTQLKKKRYEHVVLRPDRKQILQILDEYSKVA